MRACVCVYKGRAGLQGRWSLGGYNLDGIKEVREQEPVGALGRRRSAH